MVAWTMGAGARLNALLGTELPIIQAPMAGAQDSALAIAVTRAGGLGSLPCAMLTPDRIVEEVASIRAATDGPFNLNFFCHAAPTPDAERQAAWVARLAPFYREFGLDPAAGTATRVPFDETLCALVESLRPPVVSFHFGLPDTALLDRVRNVGAVVLSSATSVEEARWLEARGCDAIIAQGVEAGGHRGMFLSTDIATQVGTMALVPQIVDAVSVPVIAAGGIADGRGIAAAFALGAAGVQIGTAYLHGPDARISALHREALAGVRDDRTVLTNVMTGRPARGIINRLIREVGPMSDLAPAFPLASGAVAPLRAAGEKAGTGDFSPLWAGQAAAIARAIPAGDLTRLLMEEAVSTARRLVEGPGPRSTP